MNRDQVQSIYFMLLAIIGQLQHYEVVLYVGLALAALFSAFGYINANKS
jgi:hypothetical protein